MSFSNKLLLTASIFLFSIGIASSKNEAPKNQNSSYDEANYNNYNSESSNSKKDPKNNRFLKFYSKQGSKSFFRVYQKENSDLIKKYMSESDLKKTLVIFTARWCPYCQNFLKDFSKSCKALELKNVNVLFVVVPDIGTLQNWKNPDMTEYKNTEGEFAKYEIKVSDRVKILMLGDQTSLSSMGIDGLPVAIAIKDGHEQFRGIGESGVSGLLQLENKSVMTEFLAIWDEEETTEEKTFIKNKGNKNKTIIQNKQEDRLSQSKTEKRTNKKKDYSRIDYLLAHKETEKLNKSRKNQN